MQAMKKTESVPPVQTGISISNKQQGEILDRVIDIVVDVTGSSTNAMRLKNEAVVHAQVKK